MFSRQNRARSAYPLLLAFCGTGLGLLGLWVALASIVVSDYRTSIASAYLDTSRSAQRLGNQTARSIDQVTHAMTLVKFLYERDHRIDLPALNAAGLLGNYQDVVISVTDTQGRVLDSTHLDQATGVEFGDRAYFQASRDSEAPVFGPPLIGRIFKRLVVPGALQILDAEGRFAGAVVVAFDADMLTRSYHHDDDPATVIAIVGRDGIFRSRRVGSRPTPEAPSPAAALQRLLAADGHQTGPVANFRDHVPRFPSIAPIPGSDLYAVVATSAAPTLAKHDSLRNTLFAAGFAASALILGAAYLLTRQGRRMREVEAQRREADRTHGAILDAMPAKIILVDADATIASANDGWRRHLAAMSIDRPTFGVGRPFFETRSLAFGGSAEATARVQHDVAAVLDGRADRGGFDYLATTGDGPRWMRMTVVATEIKNRRCASVVHLNVHEHKLAEEALLRSEALNRIAGRVARIGGWTLDVRSMVLTASDEVKAVFDFHPGKALAPGAPPTDQFTVDTWKERYVGDGSRRILEAVERCVAQGVAFEIEAEALTVTGQSFWARTIGHGVNDASGAVVEVQGAVQDVSIQRLAQQQLRLLELCVARMNDMVVVTEASPLARPGPRIVFVNDAFLRMTGYARDEVMGRTPRFLQGAKTDRSELARISQALRNTQPVRAEVLNYAKSGAEYWVELSILPVRDEAGQVTHFLSVQRDVSRQRSDRQQLQLANRELEAKVMARTSQLALMNTSLLEREKEISSVLENMADCVVSVEQHGEILSVNSRASSLFGYEPQELLGAHLSKLLPSLAGQSFDDVSQIPMGACNGHGRHRNGELIDVEIALTPYKVNDRVRVTAILRDVRQRMEVLAELERARTDAEEASRTKSAFVATMSHEIRTPMNGVIGMIDVLRETRLDGEQSQMLELARESAYSLMEVVESVLDFSKIEAGKLELDLAEADLHGVFDKVFDLAHILAHKRGVALSVFLDPRIPQRVVGDAVKVRQVFLNLLSNAIKFSSGREVAGRVAMRAEVASCEAGRLKVKVTIADNGIGMSPEVLGRLFRSFTQADASTTRRFGGTGLGLTIARELTRLLGGELGVSSVVDAGSVFTVELPFDLLPAEPAAAPVTPARAFFVGGERGFVDDLRAYLEHDGARVVVMETGSEAVEAAPGEECLCVRIAASNIDAVLAERQALDRAALAQMPWLAILESGPREPRLVAAGVVVVGVKTLTLRRFRQAVAKALRGAQAEEGTLPLDGTAQGATWVAAAPREDIAPILVAEDNEINQRVLSAQLDLLGYRYEIADNGAEAFDLWKGGSYSMLLTDLHMPQVDGFSLVAAIRTSESDGKRIPIVALTANALKDEADRCMATGMDGYATKPLTLEALQALLVKWIPPAAPGASPEPPQAAAPAEPHCPLDVNVLQSVFGTDPARIQKFLGRFHEAAVKTETSMVEACARFDWAEAGDLSHQLKSSARSFGAMTLGELCDSFERACDKAEASVINALLPELRAEIAVLVDYLELRASESSPGP